MSANYADIAAAAVQLAQLSRWTPIDDPLAKLAIVAMADTLISLATLVQAQGRALEHCEATHVVPPSREVVEMAAKAEVYACDFCHEGRRFMVSVDAVNADGSVENPREAACQACGHRGMRNVAAEVSP